MRLAIPVLLSIASVASAAYRDVIQADTPVYYWPMDETSGVAMDALVGGASYDGSYHNVTLNQTGQVDGGAASFNGTTSYVDTGNLDLSAADSIAVEFLAKITDPGGDILIQLGDDHIADFGFRIQPDSSSSFSAILVDSDSSDLNSSEMAQPNTDWHHWCVVFDRGNAAATEVRIYLDGLLVLTTTKANSTETAGNFPAAQPLYIGADGSTGFGAVFLMQHLAIYADLSKEDIHGHAVASGVTTLPLVYINTEGTRIVARWVLASGTWSTPAADTDGSQEISVTGDPGGTYERDPLVGHVTKVSYGPVVSSTNISNDTVLCKYHITGDPVASQPEWNQIYSGESVLSSLDAGLVTDAEDTSTAWPQGAIRNDSTTAWPRVIFGWTFDPSDPQSVPKGKITDTSEWDCYFLAWHKYGIDLASSTCILTDSDGGDTYSGTLSKVTLTHDGSVTPVGTMWEVYRARFDLTGAATGAATVRATVYPAYGPTTTAERYTTGGAGDIADFATYVFGSHPTNTAYVDNTRTIAVTGITGGNFTPGNIFVGTTSGARGVVQVGYTSGTPLLYAPTRENASNPFNASETITEYAYGQSLVVSTGGTTSQRQWIQSGADADEYYLADGNGDPIEFSGRTMVALWEATNQATWTVAGTPGSLTARTAGLGDIDTLSVTSALYIRPSTTDAGAPLIANWPDDYLAGDWATGVTATTNGAAAQVYTGGTLATVGDPYPTVNAAARALRTYVNGQPGGFGLDTGGCTVYIKAGYQSLGITDGSTESGTGVNTSYFEVTRDPAITKAECIVVPNSRSGTPKQYIRHQYIHGVTFRDVDPNQAGIVGYGSSDNPYVWLHDIDVYGAGKERTTQALRTDTDFTFTSNLRSFNHFRSPVNKTGNTTLGYAAHVNVYFDGHSDGLLPSSNAGFVSAVNIDLRNIEGKEAGDHRDGYQSSTSLTDGTKINDQIILYNLRMLDQRYQALRFGGYPKNVAIVNMLIEDVDDGDEGAPPSFGADSKYEHHLLWNWTVVQVTGTNGLASNDTEVEVPGGGGNYIRVTNYSVRNLAVSDTSVKANILPVCVTMRGEDGEDGYGVRYSTEADVDDWYITGRPNIGVWPTTGRTWADDEQYAPASGGPLTGKLLARDIAGIGLGMGYDLYGNARLGTSGAIGAVELLGAAPNTPPVVTIAIPPATLYANTVQTILFEASATDAEDGVISGDIVWSSDLDGSLGSGATISVQLSEGTHTITAMVTDSGMEDGTDTVQVIVTGGSPYIRNRTRTPRRGP